MKVALCFIINYEHILNKENIWKEWIEPNKDIINIYFYYKDLKQIKSEWIRKHTIPPSYIYETSYYHIMPAYFSLMKFAINHDYNNLWFCMLTDSCCPIISPRKFRYLFYNNYNKSIINCSTSWWNIEHQKRANLALLPEELRLANDPWFVMKKENVLQSLSFINKQQKITSTICSGGLANESLFAIILYIYKQINVIGKNTQNVISDITHATDWNRRSSATSPHLFKDANELDINFIDDSLKNKKFVMFIRKIAPEFPDEIINYYIFEHNKIEDDKLVIKKPILFYYLNFRKYILKLFYYVLGCIFFIYIYINYIY
jgi:hypothetical protein